MDASVEDLAGRIEAALLGALAGEAAAHASAGAADLLGVAESASACGGFDEEDLRHRGLERPSRSGSAGLLLRALPFGLLSPLERPSIRRNAYRCVALAGADEGTAVTAVAAALLTADLMRFDVHTALIRVRQSLLEDAPMALLQRLAVREDGPAASAESDPVAALQTAITAIDGAADIAAAVQRAEGGPLPALTMAGALAGVHGGAGAAQGIDASALPHGERALAIAHRLAECAHAALPRVAETQPPSG